MGTSAVGARRRVASDAEWARLKTDFRRRSVRALSRKANEVTIATEADGDDVAQAGVTRVG